MSFYKEVPGRKTTLESTLKFDTAPTEGSTNPVTSDGVATAITGAVGGASEALQEQIDDIAEKAGSGYTPKGPASVATLNGLTGQENGWLYTMTDAGMLTDGSVAVTAGDTVAWDATNSVWYKAMDYAPRQYGTNEVHNLPTTITEFRTGDVIPVDGPSGTAKMGKDDLLRETAENAAILADVMEMGNISMSAGSLVYTSSSSRARTPENKPVSLMQGDKIFAKAGWQFYVAYSADGNAPYTVSGWLTSFIAPSNVKVHLLIRLAPEVTAGKNVLTSGIFTSANSSELSVSQIKPIHDGDIRKSAFSAKLDGNGTTRVRSAFYARPNTTICIVLDKVDWHVTGIEAGQYKFVIRYFKADNSAYDIIALEDANLCDNAYFIQVPSDAVRMEVFIRMDVGESLTYCVYPAPNKSDKLDSRTAIVKGVNHRGYNDIAPENTLPAFRLSAKMGFGYVETDVQKTSDGQLVCIHDLTVDRTSNGTGNVKDMTLEQLKALDFGSWKSAAYAGTKIPTFAEFLVCCRNLGLHAYIELKVGNTEQQIVQLVEAYGMKGRVSYICFNSSMLLNILSHDPKARVGLLCTYVTADDITWVNNHKTDENEIFIGVAYAYRADALTLCKAANIPLEVYTVTRSQISLADDYISGFTSNNCDASVVKYGEELLK